MTYSPRAHDRVRATQTLEGVVVRNVDGVYPRVEIRRDDGWGFELHDTDGWTFEKLQDPEPQWVNGDVVAVVFTGPGLGYPTGPRKAARVDGKWLFTDTGDKAGPHLIGNHWPDVEILYKADQPDGSSAVGKADPLAAGVNAIACSPNQDR